MRRPRGTLRGIADGVQWFTRTQAKRYLGVSLGAVKAAQRRGALQAVQVQTPEGPQSVFSLQVLAAYKARSGHGELTAQVFALLDRGTPAHRIAIDLELSPDTVSDLVQAYARLTGAWVIAGPAESRSQWCRVYGLPEQITPLLLRRCIELAARTPSIRAKLFGDR